MQVAREFTHERTKQRIAHLNTLAAGPDHEGPADYAPEVTQEARHD